MDLTAVGFLAGSTIQLLQPYLPIIAEKAAEKVGEEVPEAVMKLWNLIKARFEPKETTKEALLDLLKDPENKDLQTVLKVQLQKILIADPDFAEQLKQQLESAEKQKGTSYFAELHGSGAIAQGEKAKALGKGSISIEGQVDGDITISPKGK